MTQIFLREIFASSLKNFQVQDFPHRVQQMQHFMHRVRGFVR